MDISRQFINNPVRVWLTILLLGIGGIFALLNIGRLEDPAFTIKTAVVVTHYPGASAQQVEEEVTLPLENALQQLPYLDNVSSISSNGLSQITVNIASRYHSRELPQIWDELRRRVGDAARQFPPGVAAPFVNDDFGDVFGFFFALSGESFTNPELVRYAEQLRRELVLVGLLQEIQLYWYDKGQRKNARQRDPERFTRLLQEQEWREEPDPRR